MDKHMTGFFFVSHMDRWFTAVYAGNVAFFLHLDCIINSAAI